MYLLQAFIPKKISTNYLIFFMSSICIVYFFGWHIDIMDVDATQYATISREMLVRNDFLKVFDRGQDYLDKPPLVFWCTVISYKIFGISNFSFRLPHFIFGLTALLFTFRLAKLYYGEYAAGLSIMILASTQAFFLMNHDCRMDMALTAGIAMSVFYMALYQLNKKRRHLCLCIAGTSIAMLAKGPLGLMIPVLAFSADFAVKRKWKAFVDPNYIWALLLLICLLLPMCIGLYEQYGTDGLIFYFWKQSFGRLTGENEFIKQLVQEDYLEDPSFFYHTFAWSFSPWSILFVVAFLMEIKSLWKNKLFLKESQEIILLAGFVLTFTFLSFSKYKLPHYIFELFPFAAIITARHWTALESSFNKDYHGVITRFLTVARCILIFQIVLMIALCVVSGILVFYFFPSQNTALTVFIFATILSLSFFLFMRFTNLFQAVFTLSICTAVSINLMLNMHVYPRLLKYQTGGDIGRILTEKQVQPQHFLNFTDYGRALDFYAGQYIKRETFKTLQIPQYLNKGNVLLVNEQQYQELLAKKMRAKIVYEGSDYPVTLLTIQFLHPATRAQTTQKRYLLEII